jgi:hypothetical protein
MIGPAGVVLSADLEGGLCEMVRELGMRAQIFGCVVNDVDIEKGGESPKASRPATGLAVQA